MAARTAAVSHPPCALAPLQQPLKIRSPPQPGASSSSWHRKRVGDGGWGAGGRGQLLSLRQKDAGQHFICNHSNVFAVFRIQNPCWGCLGGGVRRASICPVDCTVRGAGEFLTASPLVLPGCSLRACHLGACTPASLRVMARPVASPVPFSAQFPPFWPGPVLNPIHGSFQETCLLCSTQANTFHKSNLYIWQIKLDIIINPCSMIHLWYPVPGLFSLSMACCHSSQACPTKFN